MCKHPPVGTVKKAGKIGLLLFVLHLLVHEVPILAGLGWAAHSAHSHVGK